MHYRTLTFVTLVAVSLHVLLGCCWHHGHQCETRVASIDVQSCPCHDHSQHQDSDDSSHHHDDECCDGASCNFYVPKDTDSDLSAISPLFWIPALDADDVSSLLAAPSLQVRETYELRGIPIPEPLHALKQVWLI